MYPSHNSTRLLDTLSMAQDFEQESDYMPGTYPKPLNIQPIISYCGKLVDLYRVLPV